MNKSIWTILFLIITLTSCDNYNLDIDPEYRIAINSYRINDTIYFQSEQNPLEFDTIRIIKIDSIRQFPILGTVPPMKQIYLRIEHLPVDNWREDKITGRKQENQPMITLENWFEECCIIRLKYREFESSIENDRFNLRNKIDTLKRHSSIKIKDNYIEELYWSNEIGIVGYKKHNGHVYRIKNAPEHQR